MLVFWDKEHILLFISMNIVPNLAVHYRTKALISKIDTIPRIDMIDLLSVDNTPEYFSRDVEMMSW